MKENIPWVGLEPTHPTDCQSVTLSTELPKNGIFHKQPVVKILTMHQHSLICITTTSNTKINHTEIHIFRLFLFSNAIKYAHYKEIKKTFI